MKSLLSIIITLFTLSLSGQQTNEWLNTVENKTDHGELLKENLRDQYLKYDFSTLILPKSEFLGYIGPVFRRLRITFNSIIKDTVDPKYYRIKGSSEVNNNICNFTGYILIQQVRLFKTLYWGVDNEFKEKEIVSQGLIIGEYNLQELISQYHSGTFQGIMTLGWYKDSSGVIHYDDIDSYSDNFNNNQYVGSWTRYSTSKKIVSNWGEFRIPFSGDLDIGAGEFSPNPKYYDKGWNSMKKE
jgi:hypothetical protein